jgi:hypothetical protein
MAANIDSPTGLPRNAPGAASGTRPKSAPAVSSRMRAVGLALRGVFILLLAVTIVRVSLPQSEELMTVYETPGDLVRVLLGASISFWIVWQAFRLPKDAEAYRTWLYISLVGIPFTLICLYYTW